MDSLITALQKNTLFAILLNTGIDRLSPKKGMANANIHASPKAPSRKICVNYDMRLATPSIYHKSNS